MSQTAQVFRSRPVLLVIVTAAAAIGAYKLLTTINGGPSKSELHRSNAVHRNRARRPPVIGLAAPRPNTPLGMLCIQQGSTTFEHDLHSGPLPDREMISQAVGVVSEDFYARAMQQAIFGILLNCSPMNIYGLQNQVTRREFLPLVGLLEGNDAGTLGRVRHVLEEQLPGINMNAVDSALQDFMLAADPGPFADQEVADTENLGGTAGEGGQGINGLLYYIAEENAVVKAYEHRGIICESCGVSPICGIRWHCLNCPDFDLCSTCEPRTTHPKMHVFVKIKIPIPVLSQPSQLQQPWYPGDPHMKWPPLPRRIKNMLVERHGIQDYTVDALYDQFSCLANIETSSDDTGVKGGIDAYAFRKALTPERWTQRFAPNAIFDRMFAFYDVDEQGFIGFSCFVGGMAYLRGPQRFESLARALQGFDIDGDGYVDRADFLRLFRAKYVLVRQLVSDMVDAQESDQGLRVTDALRTSQPISSLFRDDEIPHGEVRQPRGKQADVHGDLVPSSGTKTILDDRDPWPAERLQYTYGRPQENGSATNHDRLRSQLSRFEEMLNGNDENESAPFTMRSRRSENGTMRFIVGVDDSGGAEAATDTVGNDSEGPELSGDSTMEPPNPIADTPVDSVPNRSEVDQDALWQLVEQSFNELLDPLFCAIELEQGEAIVSIPERIKWHAEIEQAVAERQAFRKELQAGSQVDPLLATALGSHDAIAPDGRHSQSTEPAIRAELVPTDTPSLEQREADIADRPLDQLLEAAGYSTVDHPRQHYEHDHIGSEMSSSDLLPSSRTTDAHDPTMPQHRPNSNVYHDNTVATSHVEYKDQTVMDSETPSGSATNTEPGPSQQRLLRLAELENVYTDMRERGGRGRLAINEMEQSVKGDASRELRGLVIGWLDWASF